MKKENTVYDGKNKYINNCTKFKYFDIKLHLKTNIVRLSKQNPAICSLQQTYILKMYRKFESKNGGK